MTIESWRKVVKPKLHGSRNLHELFSKPEQLDFFVLTSSISATVGSSGQSNYAAGESSHSLLYILHIIPPPFLQHFAAAQKPPILTPPTANSYLDALSRHRRTHSLPSISLILPMILGIGYIAEHPEIEAQIRRKGMYGISEPEMLAAFEVAMTPQSHLPPDDQLDHIIVGLSPAPLAKSIAAAGAEDTQWFYTAPRFQALHTAMSQYTSANSFHNSHHTSILTTISTLTPAAATEAVTVHLAQRLSRLLMLEPETFEAGKGRSIASYGLDSMIGAEFRNWIFREFGVDMPFQRLLAGDAAVGVVAGELVGRARSEGGAG